MLKLLHQAFQKNNLDSETPKDFKRVKPSGWIKQTSLSLLNKKNPQVISPKPCARLDIQTPKRLLS